MEIIAKKSKSIFLFISFMLIIGIVTLPLGVYGLFLLKVLHLSATAFGYFPCLLQVSRREATA